MSRQIGAEAEGLAMECLKKQGYEILERNYFARVGEIDIIAKKGNFICFVEVKDRSYRSYGGAASAITKSKVRKILLSAKRYLHEHNLDGSNWRLDAVLIDNGEIEIIENIYTEGID